MRLKTWRPGIRGVAATYQIPPPSQHAAKRSLRSSLGTSFWDAGRKEKAELGIVIHAPDLVPHLSVHGRIVTNTPDVVPHLKFVCTWEYIKAFDSNELGFPERYWIPE